MEPIGEGGGTAERLRQLRLDAGLTQQEMGDRLHMGKARISQYENGQRRTSVQLLAQYAQMFSVSADYLLGLTALRRPLPDDESDALAFTAMRQDFASYGIAMGSNVRFAKNRRAKPGEIALVWHRGERKLALVLALAGKRCYLTEPMIGVILAQEEVEELGTAVSATVNLPLDTGI